MGASAFLKRGVATADDLLVHIPFFTCLGSEKARELSRMVARKHFRKSQVVLSEEDTARYMYVVCSGSVKVVQSHGDGNEQIISIHRRGDFFGEMALLDGKTAPATVVALEESEIGLLAKDDFDRHLLDSEQAFRQMIAALCTRLRESWLMLRVMSFADAEPRVRAVLVHLSQVHGVRDVRGVILAVKLTHKEIADYAAVSRETVTRFLGKFARDGEIAILENRNILLKSEFLKKRCVL